MLKTAGRIEYDILAQLLQEYRETAHLSQRQLAKRLGKNQSYVAKVENAQQRIDMVEVVDFATVVGKTIVEFAIEFESRRKVQEDEEI